MRRSASEVGGLEKASSVENIKVKETSKAVANRRSRSAYITSQSSGQGLEESFYLIHNGGLRNVLWCMLHTLYEIRHVATMVRIDDSLFMRVLMPAIKIKIHVLVYYAGIADNVRDTAYSLPNYIRSI